MAQGEGGGGVQEEGGDGVQGEGGDDVQGEGGGGVQAEGSGGGRGVQSHEQHQLGELHVRPDGAFAQHGPVHVHGGDV